MSMWQGNTLRHDEPPELVPQKLSKLFLINFNLQQEKGNQTEGNKIHPTAGTESLGHCKLCLCRPEQHFKPYILKIDVVDIY